MRYDLKSSSQATPTVHAATSLLSHCRVWPCSRSAGSTTCSSRSSRESSLTGASLKSNVTWNSLCRHGLSDWSSKLFFQILHIFYLPQRRPIQQNPSVRLKFLSTLLYLCVNMPPPPPLFFLPFILYLYYFPLPMTQAVSTFPLPMTYAVSTYTLLHFKPFTNCLWSLANTSGESQRKALTWTAWHGMAGSQEMFYGWLALATTASTAPCCQR